MGKGESIEDTIRIISKYANAIVIRHRVEGTAHRAALVSKVPIINGGDGAGQHPTQALYDLYTIEREVGRIDGIHVAIVGDLKYGRAARSISYLLGKYDNIHVTFVSPPELKMNSDIKEYLNEHNTVFTETDNLDDVMRVADSFSASSASRSFSSHAARSFTCSCRAASSFARSAPS